MNHLHEWSYPPPYAIAAVQTQTHSPLLDLKGRPNAPTVLYTTGWRVMSAAI